MMYITEMERKNLINNLENLLDEYDYEYTVDALDHIIDVWEENKGDLISHFKKHPNYVEGKFIIAFTNDFERGLDSRAISNFAWWLIRNADEVRHHLPEDLKEIVAREGTWIPERMYDFFDRPRYYEKQFLDDELTEMINDIFPFAHAHKGQKTSRVMNKILTYMGYNKLRDYNREYAKFADALSPLKITRHTVLSINPLDYLTMSFGNSWASCHTIDKTNKRGMPNSYHGMYSSGTMSYMLDSSSMVFYTVDAAYNGTDYWTQPKINRQMFHWGEEKLVQARLYPQDNDGWAEGYTPYRNIVQGIMATIYDFPNLWTYKSGTSDIRDVVRSCGTHYKDYYNFDTCTLSRIKGNDNNRLFYIGHDPICVECGEEHSVETSINCCSGMYRCAKCGDRINEDDVRWVDGEPYCEDCVYYCDDCDAWVLETTEVHTNNWRGWHYVCNSCRDEDYEECNDCGQWHYRGDMHWVDRENAYYCPDCTDNHFTYCSECGEYVPEDEATYIASENCYICDDCREEYFTPCSICNEPYRNSELTYSDEEDYYYCPHCWEAHTSESEAM